MEQRLLDLIKECTLRPGASEKALRELASSVEVRLPADYLALLSYTDGLEGFVGPNYLSLWSAEQVRKFGLGAYEGLPFMVFIGSNGGGEGYGYDIRLAKMPIVNIPFIGVDEPPRILGQSVVEFLERLHDRRLFE